MVVGTGFQSGRGTSTVLAQSAKGHGISVENCSLVAESFRLQCGQKNFTTASF